MSNLSGFLSQNAVKQENVKVVVSKRFIGENGNPIEWEIRSIASKEDAKIKKSCTVKTQVPGKKGLYLPETDYDAYQAKLAAACTVFPNLNDSELQDSYGVMGAESLLTEMLLPGEYVDYLSKVQEVNGFNISFEDKVNEAKN